MTDIVERLRAIDHMSIEDCFLQSPLFLHAAAEIESLRLSLSEARATGRREGLSEAAKIIEEGFDRGIKAKHLTCTHGKNGWEDCDQCAASAIRAAMEKAE